MEPKWWFICWVSWMNECWSEIFDTSVRLGCVRGFIHPSRLTGAQTGTRPRLNSISLLSYFTPQLIYHRSVEKIIFKNVGQSRGSEWDIHGAFISHLYANCRKLNPQRHTVPGVPTIFGINPPVGITLNLWEVLESGAAPSLEQKRRGEKPAGA